ncbi:uncharacterized protein KIAA1671 homolog isoform X1 [Erinaceus europaeus]|uniref:Uncharacterized protein KIAA1671 homolog isoform X1 n=1 Tax=Erinaceus europaeus TaxID=9365 RepID=A0ABM3XI93_ERIEU|nr:uncharacterized protein KIAA1671 homolog isoform X1 [Erinaceus europaeus]
MAAWVQVRPVPGLGGELTPDDSLQRPLPSPTHLLPLPRLAPKPFSSTPSPTARQALGTPWTLGQKLPPPVEVGEGPRRSSSLFSPPASPEGPPESQPTAGHTGDPLPGPRPKPRPKPRPVSAIFTEPVQPPRPGPGKMPPTPPEKTWVRRPRPLSVDLTARFESRGSAAGPGPPGDGGRTPPPNPGAPSQEASQKPWDRVPWRRAQTDGALAVATAPPREDGKPQKAPETSPPQLAGGLATAETSADGEAPGPAEQGPRGSGHPQPGEAATSPPASSDPPPQRAGVSVQDRIKGWASDGGDTGPEFPRRRTLPTRPLSADLTRLFSSLACGHQVRCEKCPEPGGEETPKDGKEKQREGHGPDGVPPRSSRRPGTFREKPPSLAEQGDGTTPAADRSQGVSLGATRTPSALTEEDNGGFQTVRATLFEHHVERHRVATSLGPSTIEPRARPGFERGTWSGVDHSEKPDSKRESSRWLESPGTKSGRPAIPNGRPQQSPVVLLDKNPLGGGSSSPPACQKVEARFELVQMPGERVHSEGVPAASQGKAGVLRSSQSRFSLGGRQRSLEGPSVDPVCRPGGQTGAVHRASSMWEARGTQDPWGKDSLRGLSPKWTDGVSRSWQDAPAVSPETIREPLAGRAAQPVFWTWEGPQGTGAQPGGMTPSAEQGSPIECPPDPPSRLQDATSQTRQRPEVPQQKPNLVAGVPKGPPSPAPAPAPEPLVRMRKASPSDPRLEKWRRRTLPHDVKFEEFNFLAPEHSGKAEQRLAGSCSPLAQSGGQDQGPGTLPVARQGSSGEPRATFFAVTYQLSEASKAKSIVKPENLMEPSRKMARPPSPHSPASSRVSLNHEEMQEPSGRGDVAQGRERASLPGTWKPEDPGRLPDPSVTKLDTDTPQWGQEDGLALQHDRKAAGDRASPSSAPQGTPAVRIRPRASHVGRTEPGDQVVPRREGAPYRASVLDLDALMQEYHRQPARAPPEGTTPERPGQPRGLERARRSWREPDAEGLQEQASSPQPGTSSPGATSGSRYGAPIWAAPPAPPSQRLPGPEGAQKRLLSAKEEEEEGRRAGGRRGPKRPDHPESRIAGQEGPGGAAAVPPQTSSSDQTKGIPRRWALRGGPPPDIKRTYSEKGAPDKLREGLAVLQEAKERRWELSRGRGGLPVDALEPSRLEPRDQQVSPLGPGTERPQDMEPQQGLPAASAPRRSQSFCRDRRGGPLVDQLKQCFSRRATGAKDTDTLVQEADSRYGACTEQRQRGDSPAPESPSPESSGWKPPGCRLSSLSSPTEPTPSGAPQTPRGVRVDAAGSGWEPPVSPVTPSPPDPGPSHTVDDFSFMDQTSVLDSSALKTRVQLSKKSGRRLPSALRHSRVLEDSLEEEAHSTWMFRDSTEEKPPRGEDSDEEEQPQPERTPTAHPQRLPALPGLDPALLKAQLHKRPDTDSPGETPSWAPQPKASRSPFQPGGPGSRVERNDRSEEPTPQWLKELKSKKRQSLYENQA